MHAWSGEVLSAYQALAGRLLTVVILVCLEEVRDCLAHGAVVPLHGLLSNLKARAASLHAVVRPSSSGLQSARTRKGARRITAQGSGTRTATGAAPRTPSSMPCEYA